MDYQINTENFETEKEKLETRYKTLQTRFETWRPKQSGICGIIMRLARNETYTRITKILEKTSQEMNEIEAKIIEIEKEYGNMKGIFTYMNTQLEQLANQNV